MVVQLFVCTAWVWLLMSLYVHVCDCICVYVRSGFYFIWLHVCPFVIVPVYLCTRSAYDYMSLSMCTTLYLLTVQS